MRYTHLLVFCLAGILPLSADVKMPAIFGEHMVLQQEIKVPVWGMADAGEKVTVTAGDHTGTATADANGKWRVDLAAFAAKTAPLTVTIAGKNTLKFNDVLIGDVWVASGQSNMEFSMRGLLNAPAEIAQANDPQLRLFHVAHATSLEPLTDVKGTWQLCTPTTIPDFSAIAYYFGRELRSKLNRPIGLIETSWGGTPVQAWISVSGLQKDPPDTSALAARQKAADGYPAAKAAYDPLAAAFPAADKAWKEKYQADFDAKMREWNTAAQQARIANQLPPIRPQPAVPRPGMPPAPDGGPNLPANLFNGMIAPLPPYAIKGAIWYQGESNAGGGAAEYRTLFPRMITDWREKWGQSDFPFLFVQLAGNTSNGLAVGGTGWPIVQEAQFKTLSLPNTGIATAADIGDAFNIHPQDKLDVGLRLALAARHVAYGEKLVYSGPVDDKITVEGGAIRVTFTQTGGGLVIGSAPWTSPNFLPIPTTSLVGFVIAGADQKFVVADAKIDGASVVVSSPEVSHPVAVRYAWANITQANLYNKEGLPAFPFRSDEWDKINSPALRPEMKPPAPAPITH